MFAKTRVRMCGFATEQGPFSGAGPKQYGLHNYSALMGSRIILRRPSRTSPRASRQLRRRPPSSCRFQCIRSGNAPQHFRQAFRSGQERLRPFLTPPAPAGRIGMKDAEREVFAAAPYRERSRRANPALEGFAGGGGGLVALEFPVRCRSARAASEVRRDGSQPLSCMKCRTAA